MQTEEYGAKQIRKMVQEAACSQGRHVILLDRTRNTLGVKLPKRERVGRVVAGVAGGIRRDGCKGSSRCGSESLCQDPLRNSFSPNPEAVRTEPGQGQHSQRSAGIRTSADSAFRSIFSQGFKKNVHT